MTNILEIIEPYYQIGVYGLIVLWTLFSIYYIAKLEKKRDLNKVNTYIYDSIPTLFTTLGVLGTFVGIFFGLQEFDVDNITKSIPPLLEGLKTAFLTSIIGIILSIIFGKISQIILKNVEFESRSIQTDEISALNEILLVLKNMRQDTNNNFQVLNRTIIGDDSNSISTQFSKLKNILTESHTRQKQILTQIYDILGGDEDASLLAQIQNLRAEQNDYSLQTTKNIEWIVQSMNKNNQLISKKFDEFSELLAKNNTEALVNVMKQATEQFNAQMSALIEKLVQENFQELNNSVQRMNQWQQDNKEMITQLTEQFKSVSKEFSITSTAIKEITTNTAKLTDENGYLSRLIEELQEVMIEDTKYQEIVEKLTDTINTLKENTDAFDETTNKLNNWVRNQMSFSDSVAKLLTQLEDIKEYKIETVPALLDIINDEFYERLGSTLQNLDTLIHRIIANYKR